MGAERDAAWYPVLGRLRAELELLAALGADALVASAPAAGPDRAPAAQQLAALAAEAAGCRRCALAATRTHVVFGEGPCPARLMFVGEGPGANEDRTGRPFVGRAGQLLDRMIKAMGLARGEVYITNVVKCRPPGNRVPSAEEVARCRPWLEGQIELVQPEVIVALGASAARALTGSEQSVGALRGRLHEAGGRTIVVSYHPAYLLRNPDAKRLAWQDLQLAMRVLGLPLPRRTSR